MAGDEFEVDIEPYEGLDVARIASEELFKAAIRTQRIWRQNLRDEGWKNTGEAINDITVNPQEEGSLRYETGGDVPQLVIPETGRAPGEAPPPFDPIADWAREKGLQPDEGQTFEEMVEALRFSIAEEGIEAFHPAQRAAMEVQTDLGRRTSRRFESELSEME